MCARDPCLTYLIRLLDECWKVRPPHASPVPRHDDDSTGHVDGLAL